MKLAKTLSAYVLILCLFVAVFSLGVAAETDNSIQVKYQRLILNDALTMRFDLTVDQAALDNATVNAKVAGATVLTGQKIAELPAGEEGCYQLCVDLAAAQLADTVTLELVDNGEIVDVRNYCALNYANFLLAGDYGEKTKELVRATLHYGAAAQVYFGYNTANLANAGLAAQEVEVPQPDRGAVISGSVSGISYYGATLMIESRVAVRLYFEADSLEGIDFGTYKPVEKNGIYYVEIPGINPQDYDKEIVLNVTNGSEVMTVSYSPMVYILRKYASADNPALKALAAAMYQYHCAGKAYLADDSKVVIDGNGIVLEEVLLSGEKSSAVVPAGTQLEENVTTLTLSATPMAETGSNVALGENEKMVSLDVHIAGISKENTVPIIVTLDQLAPEFLNQGNICLYHVENGETVVMTRVYSADELDAHNEYYYDIATGTVTVAMASFSELVAVANEENLWNGDIDTEWYNGTDKVFEIFNADQLAGLGKLVDDGNTFAGKTIKLGFDINLKGYQRDENGEIKYEDGEKMLISFNPIGYGYNVVFKGTFDGNGHTIRSLYQHGWDMGLSYSTAGGGLFASAVDATFKNLTLDNAYVVMECIDMGTLVGYAYGTCHFENIIVSDSLIANYNRYTGGVIGEINGKHTLINVDVDAGTTVGALWGTFDPSVGGIIGGKWGEATVYMERCDVACTLDVFNDVTSAYQWYSYRRCGMLIGNTEESRTEASGRTVATASFLTTKDCTVAYGDWVNYHYCEFTNAENSGRNYPWVRAEAGEFTDAYSNPRYGHPGDINGDPVAADHDESIHAEGDTHYMIAAFHQLYGGGQGCYGGNDHIGNGVTEITAPQPVEKFVPIVEDGFKIKTGTTVKLGSLFQAAELTEEQPQIQNLSVIAFVSPVTEDGTVRATFTKFNSDWTQSTLTFSGRGDAIITIQDYYYCKTTQLYIHIPEAGEYIIVDHQILGQWVDDREDLGHAAVGAQLSYDLNMGTYWNPKASNDPENLKYYYQGEGILYTLDEAHDVNQIQLTFGGQAYYFDLYVSANGVDYEQVAAVTSQNYGDYYNVYVATFTGPYTNVKYIKVLFTGSALNQEGNHNVWVTLKEISLSVADATVTEDDREVVKAGIAGHEIVGTWTDDYGSSASLGPQKSYDGDAETSYWQGQVPNYTSGAGIIYELDGAYDLKEIILTQQMRPYYFDLYISTDGENYTLLTKVDADNYVLFYENEFVCRLDNLSNVGIRYIKLIFTGNTTNSLYTSLKEIAVQGVKLESVENS